MGTIIYRHFGCILMDHINLGVAHVQYHPIHMWWGGGEI